MFHSIGNNVAASILERTTWVGAQEQLPAWMNQAGVRYGFGPESLPGTHYLKQVHGRHVVRACVETEEDFLGARLEGDGIFTMHRREAVGVKTADCVSILVAQKGGLVMALHAGWRGLISGVIAAGFDAARKASDSKEPFICFIGPTIGREAFEVGPEVVESFLKDCPIAQEQKSFCLSKGIQDRWHLDLAACAVFSLADMGVAPQNIAVLRSCTKSNPTLWQSFRRDKEAAGRNWSWIMLD